MADLPYDRASIGGQAMSADNSPQKNNPCVVVKVICPVCGRESSQRYVKSKIYQPLEIEKDHHVVTYKWTDEAFAAIRPENFYIWHCPHCHFADENDVFRDKIDPLWKGRLDFICDKIKEAGKDALSFTCAVGDHIDHKSDLITTDMAILRHLIACYIQESFLTANNRLSHKLSRFYLRLAWLFRERATLSVSDTAGLPNGFLTLEEYLSHLSRLWPELPRTEAQALKKAILYYTELLNQSSKDDDVKKDITLMFLLLELNRRAENLDEGYKYIRNIFTLAMKRRQAVRTLLDQGVHNGKLNSQQIEQMRSLITWLSNAIEESTEAGDAINEEIFWAEYNKARELALANAPLVPQKILEKLREASFHEITCRKVASLCVPPKGGGLRAASGLPGLEELREKERKLKEEKLRQQALAAEQAAKDEQANGQSGGKAT